MGWPPETQGRQLVNALKRNLFILFQPATLALIVLLWASAPASLLDNTWVITVTSIGTLAMVQALEFVNERHAGWRLNPREFLTDLFYLSLYYAVILKIETKLAEEPLASAKHALGITTAASHGRRPRARPDNDDDDRRRAPHPPRRGPSLRSRLRNRQPDDGVGRWIHLLARFRDARRIRNRSRC